MNKLEPNTVYFIHSASCRLARQTATLAGMGTICGFNSSLLACEIGLCEGRMAVIHADSCL